MNGKYSWKGWTNQACKFGQIMFSDYPHPIRNRTFLREESLDSANSPLIRPPPPPGMENTRGRAGQSRFQRGRGRTTPRSDRFARPEDPPPKPRTQRFASVSDAKFDARDPTRFLRDSPRVKPISPPVKAKPPDYREIEVGITSGPEDAPDVLLEREAVEVGKNETYRSLTV